MLTCVISLSVLTYRRIDPETDGETAAFHHRDACIESFGDDRSWEGRDRYLGTLRSQVEEFPDGCVLGFEKNRCVGQLQLQIPYGMTVGYINLFYVTAQFRGRGYGRLLHEYVERYFRAWEARRIELHVSPTNARALRFYLGLGYWPTEGAPRGARLWSMAKDL